MKDLNNNKEGINNIVDDKSKILDIFNSIEGLEVGSSIINIDLVQSRMKDIQLEMERMISDEVKNGINSEIGDQYPNKKVFNIKKLSIRKRQIDKESDYDKFKRYGKELETIRDNLENLEFGSGVDICNNEFYNFKTKKLLNKVINEMKKSLNF